jgi:hypothetical protein
LRGGNKGSRTVSPYDALLPDDLRERAAFDEFLYEVFQIAFLAELKNGNDIGMRQAPGSRGSRANRRFIS